MRFKCSAAPVNAEFFLPSKLYLFISIIYLCSFNLAAQDWEYLGGPSGKVSEEIFMTNKGRLLSINEEGLYFSDDYGINWLLSSQSPNINYYRNFMQRKNGEIYAKQWDRILSSPDEGNTWKIVYTGNKMGYEPLLESPVTGTLFNKWYSFDTLKISKSTDDGKSWIELAENNFKCFAIDDSGWLYIAGKEIGVLKSTDEGETFNPVYIGFISYVDYRRIVPLHSGGFISEYFDQAANNYKLRHYENLVSTTTISIYPFLAITPEQNLVYRYSDKISIYETSSRTFKTVTEYINQNRPLKLAFFQNHWIADLDRYGIHHSYNRGATWEEVTSPGGINSLHSLVVTGNGKFITSAQFYRVFQSSNEGQSWERINPDIIEGSIVEICRLKNRNLIAATTNGIYIANGDGNNWVKKGLYNLQSMIVSKKGIVYTVDLQRVYVSINNGLNWKNVNNGLETVNYVSFGEGLNNRIFITSETKDIFYTDNDGMNWSKIESPVGLATITDIETFNDTIYATGTSGIYYSSDNGLNWKRMTNFSLPAKKLLITPGGDFIVIAGSDEIYRYKKEIKSWFPYNSGIADRNVNYLTIDKYFRIYAVSDSGIFRSKDYVNSYIFTLYPQSSSLTSNNVQLKWAAIPGISNYHLQVSEERSFETLLIDEQQLSDTSYNLNYLDFSKTYFWRIGVELSFGSFYSDVVELFIAPPDNFVLRQNYPNPFNSNTNLIIDIPYTSKIQLKVFNSIGEEVMVLKDGEVAAGTHKFTVEANNLSSGVYFYSLYSEDFREIKKMILLK